jgi:hypothetical protein
MDPDPGGPKTCSGSPTLLKYPRSKPTETPLVLVVGEEWLELVYFAEGGAGTQWESIL